MTYKELELIVDERNKNLARNIGSMELRPGDGLIRGYWTCNKQGDSKVYSESDAYTLKSYYSVVAVGQEHIVLSTDGIDMVYEVDRDVSVFEVIKPTSKR